MADEFNSTNQCNEQNSSSGIPPASVTPSPQMPDMPSVPPVPPSVPNYSSPWQAPQYQQSGDKQSTPSPVPPQNGQTFNPGGTPQASPQYPYYQQPSYIPDQVPTQSQGSAQPPYCAYPRPDGSFSPYPPQNNPYAPRPGRGFAVASLVLGICSIVLCCVWYFSVILAILSFIFGIVGVKKGGGGMATAGIITSAVGFVLAVAVIIMVIASIGNSSYGWYQFWEEYEEEFMRGTRVLSRLFRR